MKLINKKFIKEMLTNILIAIVFALILVFFIRPTIVRQTSMQNTLNPGDYLLMYQRAYTFKTPEYGDIIVFESNIRETVKKNKLLIKRVIGLGGDTIQISDGKVYRNGTELKEDYTKDGTTPGDVNITVPENQCFVMGDNRIVSVDSRSDMVGCVPYERIKGKAIVRLFPFTEIRKL